MNLAMKTLSALAIAAAALTASAGGPASAALVTLQGTYSFSQIAETCSKSGGNLASDGEGYACTKNNCDGKGGQCVVGCGNDGKCYGTTPDRFRGAGGFGKLGGATRLDIPGTTSTSNPINNGNMTGRPINAAPSKFHNPVRVAGTGVNPIERSQPILGRSAGRKR